MNIDLEVANQLLQGKIAVLEAALHAVQLQSEQNERVAAAYEEAGNALQGQIEMLDDDIAHLIDENAKLRAELEEYERAEAQAAGVVHEPVMFPMFLDPGVHSNS